MATPYLQHRVQSAPSTQDLARELLEDLPVLVLAAEQTAGRGRSGAAWQTAPRALAASLALNAVDEDRPLPLMAGVAAVRVFEETRLKWPNDLIKGEEKIGGILVERSDSVVTIGLGVNLWWPDRPRGFGSMYESDPGEEHHLEVGSLWGAEMMRLIDAPRWPCDEYLEDCLTIGRLITWEPDGQGRAIGVADDGGLVVETGSGVHTIYSGVVRHIR